MIKAIAFDFTEVMFTSDPRCRLNPLQADIAQTFGLINPDEAFTRHFASKYALPSEEVEEEVRELISRLYILREPDLCDHLPPLKLAAATNHLSFMVDYFMTLPISNFFYTAVSSGMCGWTKPDPRFFDLVAQRLEEDPADILFVDDTRANCEGAARAGFKVLNFTRGRKLSAEVNAALARLNAEGAA